MSLAALASLPTAVAPALPLHTAGKYVAGAYIVFLAIVLIYVGIMATRLSRTERELIELRRDVEARRAAQDDDRERAPVA
jgi:hypothetical protein